MGPTLATIVTTAVGIVLSPLAIAALISMLMGAGGRAKGVAFLWGWVSGLSVVGLLTLLLADLGAGEGSQQPLWAYVVRVLLGAGLLVLAWRAFAKRPRSAAEAKVPGWITAIDSMGPARTFGLGALLAGVKPKNLLLTISAMVALGLAGLAPGRSAGLFALFVALSSVGIATPVLLAVLAGEGGRRVLGRWRDVLIRYNAVLVIAVLVIIGVKVLIDGLSGLAS